MDHTTALSRLVLLTVQVSPEPLNYTQIISQVGTSALTLRLLIPRLVKAGYLNRTYVGRITYFTRTTKEVL